jgi:5-methylcytosine-specific restriction endonuclease McrA
MNIQAHTIIGTNNLKTPATCSTTSRGMTEAHWRYFDMSILSDKKQCSECGEWKEKNDFHKSSKSKDGYKAVCKECRKSETLAYYSENSETIKARVSVWQKENKDKRRVTNAKYAEKHPESQKKYYRTNAFSVIERALRWALANPDKRREIKKKWRQNNKEQVNSFTRARRAKRKGSGGIITDKEWLALKEKYNNTCLRCKRQEPEIKLTLDHVIPLESEGPNTIDNAQPLCGSCNSWKNARTIDYR